MSRNFWSINNKIFLAMNYKYGTHLVVNQRAFYNENNDKVILYVTADAVNRETKVLFKTASAAMSCLFARDLLAAFDDKEPDFSNEQYQRIFMRNDGYGAIDYLKGRYGETNTLDPEPRQHIS